MAKGPETRLQKKMQGALEKEFPGSFFFKVHGGPYQTKGIPDLVGCINGRFIAIEVKIPGRENKATDIQIHILSLIVKAGGIAFISTSPEDVIKRIKEYLSI